MKGIVMWIARDKNNNLYLYLQKPRRELSMWNECVYMEIDENLFPEVKWEDDEPTEVELIIKAK